MGETKQIDNGNKPDLAGGLTASTEKSTLGIKVMPNHFATVNTELLSARITQTTTLLKEYSAELNVSIHQPHWRDKWRDDTQWQLPEVFSRLESKGWRMDRESFGAIVNKLSEVPGNGAATSDERVRGMVKLIRAVLQPPSGQLEQLQSWNPKYQFDVVDMVLHLLCHAAKNPSMGLTDEHRAVLLDELVVALPNLPTHATNPEMDPQERVIALAEYFILRLPGTYRRDIASKLADAYPHLSSAKRSERTTWSPEDLASSKDPAPPELPTSAGVRYGRIRNIRMVSVSVGARMFGRSSTELLKAGLLSPQKRVYLLLKDLVQVRHAGDHSDYIKGVEGVGQLSAATSRSARHKEHWKLDAVELRTLIGAKLGKTAQKFVESRSAAAFRPENRIALAPMWDVMIGLLPELSEKRQLEILKLYQSETKLSQFDAIQTERAETAYMPSLTKLAEYVSTISISSKVLRAANKILDPQLALMSQKNQKTIADIRANWGSENYPSQHDPAASR